MNVDELAQSITAAARASARVLACASSATKDFALAHLASRLRDPEAQAQVLAANARDLEAGQAAGLSVASLDRLRLDERRLLSLADAVDDVLALPDPVGRIDSLRARPSGIQVGRMHVPLGVILLVYESRPNVTIDAAALCLKAGNAVILRGGREAMHSNAALAALVGEALGAAGLPAHAAQWIDSPERELLYALLRRSGEIDLAIPRGGPSLIAAVNEHARVPVVQHYQGICHVYVHEGADLEMAERIAINAKVQRPGVCNAMECLLVDEAVAPALLSRLLPKLAALGVEVRMSAEEQHFAGDARQGLVDAVPADFDTEFLSLALALKVVSGFEDALSFIAAHGSQHTASIVTGEHAAAMAFLRRVDASCVLVNASTRFNDGGELGLGAELGISTTKLHAYGPMGLEELCTRKFVVLGHGEVRGSPP